MPIRTVCVKGGLGWLAGKLRRAEKEEEGGGGGGNFSTSSLLGERFTFWWVLAPLPPF